MISYVCFNKEGTVAHSPAGGLLGETKCGRILESGKEFEWAELTREFFTAVRCHHCKEFDTAEVCKLGEWPKTTDGILDRIQEMLDTPEEEWDVINQKFSGEPIK